MSKIWDKYKYWFIIGVIAVIVFVALFFGIDDKDFYKEIVEWKLNNDKEYKKKVLKRHKEKDGVREKKIKEIDEEIKKIDKKKKEAKKNIDSKPSIKVGEAFKEMGY